VQANSPHFALPVPLPSPFGSLGSARCDRAPVMVVWAIWPRGGCRFAFWSVLAQLNAAALLGPHSPSEQWDELVFEAVYAHHDSCHHRIAF
jgi:hypothetical protein